MLPSSPVADERGEGGKGFRGMIKLPFIIVVSHNRDDFNPLLGSGVDIMLPFRVSILGIDGL